MRNGFSFVALALLVVLLGVAVADENDRIEPKFWPASMSRPA